MVIQNGYLQKFRIVLRAVIGCCLSFSLSTAGPREQVLALSDKVMGSRILYVAADVAIADHLAHGALDINQLAEKTVCHAESLSRLMRSLLENNIFMQTAAGDYCNNELSEFLRQDHPQTVRPFVLHNDETRWQALGNLGYSVKTGKPAFDYLYGESYFAYTQKHPVLSKRFDDAMTIISAQEDAAIARIITCAGTVADIGGGKGQLLKEIHAQHPQVQLVLVDLPQVVQELHDLPAAITAVSGSFFEPLAVRADTFILKRVLHDWQDAQALFILKNVAAAMQEDTTLCIVDAVIDRCESRVLITNIDLLLFAIFGGKERNYKELEYLCAQAGLQITNVQPLSPIIHMLTCKKIMPLSKEA